MLNSTRLQIRVTHVFCLLSRYVTKISREGIIIILTWLCLGGGGNNVGDFQFVCNLRPGILIRN